MGIYFNINNYTMTSTYDQFLNRFKAQLRAVAEFGDDGEEATTLDVITESLNASGLKDICENYDALKLNGGNTSGPVEVSADTDKKAKKTTTKKTATKSADIFES